MFERELTVYEFLLGYGRRLVADIDDAALAEQPFPGCNHPAWQLGHLAYVAHSAVRHLGETPTLDPTWKERFGTGSRPLPDRSAYPSKDELLAAHESGHRRLARVIVDAPASAFEGENPVDFVRRSLPTTADLLAHVLTSHEAMHLGHVSFWRRARGLPYLF